LVLGATDEPHNSEDDQDKNYRSEAYIHTGEIPGAGESETIVGLAELPAAIGRQLVSGSSEGGVSGRPRTGTSSVSADVTHVAQAKKETRDERNRQG
jgi:hypothetical protein